MLETYAEYGAVGVVILLFGYMVLNLMSSQKLQNEDLDQIRQANAKLETKMSNVESIILKMLDRWNKSDEGRDRRYDALVENAERRHEKLTFELRTHSESLNYLKGKLDVK